MSVPVPTSDPSEARDARVVMDDRLPGRRLAVVAATGIVVILVGAAVSTAMVLVRPAPPPGGGQAASAIGMVEQTPVEVQDRGLAVERRARASLGAYGWADVDAGVAQLPIDQAMSRVVASYAAGDGGAR